MTEVFGFVGRILKRVAAREGDDIPSGTNHQFGFEWQSPEDFRAQFCLADVLTDDKCSRRAHVDHSEIPQLLGQNAWLKPLVTADVDGPKKYDRCHGILPTFR